MRPWETSAIGEMTTYKIQTDHLQWQALSSSILTVLHAGATGGILPPVADCRIGIKAITIPKHTIAKPKTLETSNLRTRGATKMDPMMHWESKLIDSKLIEW